MAATRGSVTAHIARIQQDSAETMWLVMSEAQVLELISVLTVGLREKATHADGYRIAIWKKDAVASCQANPPCEGGSASLNLLRPGRG